VRDRAGRVVVSCIVVAGVFTAARAAEALPSDASEARAVEAYEARVEDYRRLHRKLESSLPRIPKRGTTEQIDKNQRLLGELIKTARRDAKPGEFFTPEIQALARRVLASVLAGPDGKIAKSSIMDENPGLPTLVLNERYPPSVPRSMMPPQVLAALPKLKEEIEYRFIGSRLILLDSEADIILDFTGDVLSQ